MEVEPHSSALHVDILPSAFEEDSNHCNGSSHQLESEGGDADNLADGTLSPTSLRRSTRVSALKAQKKLKTKDGEMVEGQRTASVSPNDAATTAGHATKDLSVAKAVAKRKLLKRKLSGGGGLDQYDCKFGIRLDSHGDVYVMSDESEISSLNDEEVGELRQRYDSWRNQDVSDEVKKQRRIQLCELDVLLQQEEANLALMKKLRANQLKSAADKRLPTTAQVGQNAAGASAYKPAVATMPTNHNAKLNGTSHSKVNNKGNANRANSTQQQSSATTKITPAQMQQMLSLLMSKASTPQQLTQLMKSLPPNFVNQMIQANMQQQQPQTAAGASRQPSQSAGSQSSSASRSAASAAAQQQAAAVALAQQQQAIAAAAAAAAAEAKSQAVAKAAAEALAIRVAEVQHNNAQRIASARIQLRRYMEQQLQQLSLPKPPGPELSFVPNANQPDFYTMLGLDLVVQRVRKDKTVYKKWESEPYVCEQCSTDFTPAWEAIEGNNGEYHLYCRQCVRQAQKRKNRTEHNNLFKCAFSKIKDQEKEFEKQVAAGKFSDPIPTTITGTNTTNSVTTTSANSSAIGGATTASTAAASGRAAAAQQQQSGGSAASSHSHHYHHTSGLSAVSQSQSHHQPHYTQQSSSGSSTPQRGAQNLTKKRSTNTSSGTSGSSAATSSGGASNSNISLQLMNALRNNPAMMTATMSTPMMAQNLIQLMSQRGGQGTAGNNALLSAIMAHMAQSSQQHSSTSSGGSASGGRHSTGGGGGSATSRNDASSSSAAAAASLNPIWALNTQLNASTLLNNPQLQEHVRQLHQAQMFATASKKK